jgi:luciferase family oxidoreductase group 1
VLKLGILDQSPIRKGGSAAQAIAESLKLAQAADGLGYRRYWVAEHHNAEGLAGTAPEILIARIAALTQHIRVGAGGVMLSHYSPLKVAETFRMLETLYPGCIDLGIGRAPGSDQLTAHALASIGEPLPMERFPNQVFDLLGFLGNRLPADHPFASVRTQPEGINLPEVWLLGSTDQSAALAAHLGQPFSFAQFITDRMGPEIMEAYRLAFQPSARWLNPQGSIGVFVICAESEAEADRLALSRDLWRLELDKGRLGPFPSIEEAASYPYDERDRAIIAHNRRRQIIGTPKQVKAGLEALAGDYGVEEVIVVTITYDFAARLRSYQLLAEVFGFDGTRNI